MIQAKAIQINAHQLALLFEYPDHRAADVPVLVEDLQAARLKVNQEARKYISELMTEWLKQRINHFNYIKDPSRAAMADQLINMIMQRHDLMDLVTLILNKEYAIKMIAPGVQSRYYRTYSCHIRPCVVFCHEFKEGKYNG